MAPIRPLPMGKASSHSVAGRGYHKMSSELLFSGLLQAQRDNDRKTANNKFRIADELRNTVGKIQQSDPNYVKKMI
jgi:hypothetical protein